MYRSDSMAFFAPQMQPPIFDPAKRPQLNLAHLTSVPPFITDFNKVLEQHRGFKACVLSNDNVIVAEHQHDLEPNGSQIAVVFGLQCPPKDLTKERLQILHDAGVLFMALAYEDDTEYGGGFKTKSLLTKRGKQLLDWMQEIGIQPDLSHASNETAVGIIKHVSNTAHGNVCPVLTHSACLGKHNHPRNATGDVMNAIEGLGGYIGIPALSPFLAAKWKDPLDAFLQHVEYAILECGRGGVGIGSDCQHCDMTIDDAKALYKRMMGKFAPVGMYFPDRDPLIIENGSQILNVLEFAVLRKMASSDREHVMGKNFKNYLKRVLPI